MSLRTRLLWIFGTIVVVTLALVSYVVSNRTRKAFQRLDERQTRAIIDQFTQESDLQRESVAIRTAAIARSRQVSDMAVSLAGSAGDPAAYLNLAPTLAAEQQLDYLELLDQSGTIISSAQWQARFGLREEWVTGVANWNKEPAFWRYEETPQSNRLALIAVREISEGDKKFYVVAGRSVDSNMKSLVLPVGTRWLLWQPNSNNTAGELEDASGPVEMPPELKPMLDDARTGANDNPRRVRLNDSPDGLFVVNTVPLLGRNSSPIAVLVVASSRSEIQQLQAVIRNTGLLAALAGILLSILASQWWAGRISRPIEELSSAAQEVAAGNWDRKVYAEALNERNEVAQLITSFNQMTDELVRQRDRALQAERVAAWRELARRLAHELKNPLFPLQITVENLMKAHEQNSPEFNEIFSESTATLLAELSNLKKIIGRFSDFSRMPAPHLQDVNVNRMLDELGRLFAPQLATAAKPIKLETRLAAADTTIAGDPELLRRAFENLVLNAIDAMSDGGTITFATSAEHVTVVVEISDSGTGLTQEETDRLFTPYYTTKQHGTGLGLAIVQSVISDHGARISVASKPGEGTTFRIEFQSGTQGSNEREARQISASPG
jgi:nitrogen fixation/metabolism regulation signal transduction histidine kinase